MAKYEPHIAVLNECKLDFNRYKFNISDYDKIHESKHEAWSTCMYIRRGIRWAQVDLIPGRDETDRCIEGVAIRVTTDFTSGAAVLVRGIYVSGGRQAGIRPELQELITAGDSINIGDCNLRMTMLGHSVTRGAGLEVQQHIIEGLCTLVHTGLPSRPNYAGNGILDVALVTGELQHTVNARARQIDCIASDHVPWIVTMNLEVEEERQPCRNMRPLYEDEAVRKHYRDILLDNLNPHEDIATDADCDRHVATIERALLTALDEVAPLKVIERRDLLPDDIVTLIRTRSWAKRRRQRRRRSPESTRVYHAAKRALADRLREYREERWHAVIDSKRDNRAKMWQIQRSLKRPPQQIPQLPGAITELETINSLVDKAIIKKADVPDELTCVETTTPFQPLRPTNPADVKQALYRCKNKKAPGPDAIRADAMKLAGPAFVAALTKIVNYVLKTGRYPPRWKKGDCIFLHKPGKPYRDAASYRPITLLNIMGKVCERVMQERVLEACNNIIPEFQHGFRAQRGTGYQLLRTGKFIADALERKYSVAMISTDLSKAFASINHKRLVAKLRDADVPNNITKLLEDYLAGRRIRGKYRTVAGTEQLVPHGVPQGSILGPLVFNLYVHDIPKTHIAGQMLSQYADDLCILNAAVRPGAAITRAEWAAREIVNYYEQNGLKCNIAKTECILFTTRRKHARVMRIRGEDIAIKSCIKYLGVHLDKRLSMNKHAEYTVRKAKQARGMLGPIIGYYSNCSINTKLAVIQACLLPVLDYGVVQLLPRFSKTNLLRLERQYRMALKAAGQFPRQIPTEMLWDMLDEDPWHLRVADLHADMLNKLSTLCVPDINTHDAPYLRYGQHNPALTTSRMGEIEYLPKLERSKPVSKRTGPRRDLRL